MIGDRFAELDASRCVTHARSVARARTLLVAIALLASACGDDRSQPVAPGNPDALVTVEGESITLARFRDVMESSLRNAPRNYETLESRQRLLWKMVDESVVAAHARKAGYEDAPQVREVVRRMVVEKFLADRLEPKLAAVTVEEAEIRELYDRDPELYRTRERVLPAVIAIGKPAGASEAEIAARADRMRMAREGALALSPNVANFGEVAADFSEDVRSRASGGEIGWITEGSTPSWIDERIADAAFELERVGEIGEVIETERAFYLVKLVDRSAAVDRQFETVRDGIRMQLERQRRDEVRRQFLDELRRELRVAVAADADQRLDALRWPSAAASSGGAGD